MPRKSRRIKKTILRYKGKNCDGTKRKQLDEDDKHEMRKNLEYGRYVMACRTVGIEPASKLEYFTIY